MKLLVSGDALFTNRRKQIIALAARHAIPAIYGWREYIAAGGLATYGSSLAASYRQTGIYTGRILNGAKPADLPIIRGLGNKCDRVAVAMRAPHEPPRASGAHTSRSTSCSIIIRCEPCGW